MPNQVQNTIAEICNEYDIADLYVFGSRAAEIAGVISRGFGLSPKSDSDVDIGVLPAKRESWSPEKRVDLTMALEDLFQAKRVDLVLLPEADPYVALDVIRGELLFSADLDRQARYELFVLRRAADLLPFKRDRIRMIMEEGAR